VFTSVMVLGGVFTTDEGGDKLETSVLVTGLFSVGIVGLSEIEEDWVARYGEDCLTRLASGVLAITDESEEKVVLMLSFGKLIFSSSEKTRRGSILSL
jgi:hypothetical protein